MLGLAAGVLNIVMGKSLDETVPARYSTMFGCQTNNFICISVFLALILGLVLPTDEAQFAADQHWRAIFAVPIVFAVAQIGLYLTVCPYEPVNFSIAKGRDDEALLMLKKLYSVKPEQGKNDDDVYL